MIAILHALGMLVADLFKARARAQNPENSVPHARVIDALNPARFVRRCVPKTLSVDDLRFDREISLFLRQNSLFPQNNSLFCCVGNFAGSL
jgi:hypothetical protein